MLTHSSLLGSFVTPPRAFALAQDWLSSSCRRLASRRRDASSRRLAPLCACCACYNNEFCLAAEAHSARSACSTSTMTAVPPLLSLHTRFLTDWLSTRREDTRSRLGSTGEADGAKGSGARVHARRRCAYLHLAGSASRSLTFSERSLFSLNRTLVASCARTPRGRKANSGSARSPCRWRPDDSVRRCVHLALESMLFFWHPLSCRGPSERTSFLLFSSSIALCFGLVPRLLC